jgi:hypothetical protein
MIPRLFQYMYALHGLRCCPLLHLLFKPPCFLALFKPNDARAFPPDLSRPPLHALVALNHILDLLLCHSFVLWSGKSLAKQLQKLFQLGMHSLEPDRALKLAPIKTQIGIP